MPKTNPGTQLGPSTLQDQLSTLRRQLNHRDPAALRKAVLAMFMAYRATGHDLEGSVGAYCAILSDQPADSAIRACLEFPRGKYREAIPTSNAAFPPSADELHQAAQIEAGYYHRELERLERAAGLGASSTGRYRPAKPGEKTVGEIEAEKDVAEGFELTAEDRQRRRDELAEVRAEKVASIAGDRIAKETGRDRALREGYNDLAAISKGKAPVAGAVIPAEHRIDVKDLPPRDTRTEAQKAAAAKAWVESYAAEHGIDLASIPDQPSTFHRPRAS